MTSKAVLVTFANSYAKSAAPRKEFGVAISILWLEGCCYREIPVSWNKALGVPNKDHVINYHLYKLVMPISPRQRFF